MKTLLALLMTTTMAWADMPPDRYDIEVQFGRSMTVAEIKNAMNEVRFHPVPFGKAYDTCNRIYRKRFNQRYPYSEAKAGRKLYGCHIANADGSKPEIVYSFSWSEPDMAHNVVKHEVGHELGWSGNHEDAKP